MNNRILAMLLAIIMVVSMVPVNALADEVQPSDHICMNNLGSERISNNDGTHYARCNKCTAKITVNCSYDNADDYVCNLCGYLKDHTHVDTSDGVCDIDGCEAHVHRITQMPASDPDCDNRGTLAYYYCSVATCGKVFKDAEGKVEGRASDYILNPVHKNLEHREAEPATCTTAGQEAHTKCVDCGKYFSDREAKNVLAAKPVIEALGHKLKKVAKVEKTCETQGNIEYYECETCGKYFEDDQAAKEITNKDAVKYPLPLADHQWSAWTGEDATGHLKTCTVCGTTNTKRAHANFSYENGKQICGDCGYEFDHICVDTYAGGNHKCDACSAELEHDVHWNSNGSGKHYTTCEDAKCFKAGTTLTGWEDCVDTDNDCVCNTCGGAMQHTYEVVNGVAATCEENGHTAYKQCSNCDLIVGYTYEQPIQEKDYVIPATGHTEAIVLVDMQKHQKVCTVCEKELAEPETHDVDFAYTAAGGSVKHMGVCKVCVRTIDAPHAEGEIADCTCDVCGFFWGHELEKVDETPATCEATGIHAHNKCKNCGKTFGEHNTNVEVGDDYLILPAINHWVTGWEIDNAKDTHKKVCKRSTCGKALVAEEPHEFTYTVRNDGRHNAVCDECGFTQARAHVDEEAPFCKCDDCGAELTHGRKYVEWLEPDCVNDGHTDYYECEKCGLKYLSNGKETDPTIPKLGHNWGTVKSMSSSTYCGDLNHFKSCLRGNCDEVEIIPCVDANEDCVCDLSGKLMHSHRLIKNDGQEATCTEDGYEEYYTYFGCGKLVEDKVIIPATGHDEENAEWKPCANGQGHELKCPVCSELLDSETVHDFSGEAPYCVDCGAPEGLERVDEVAATCTATGMKEYWISNITNRRYSDAAGTQYISDVNTLIIPKLAHEWEVVSTNGTKHVIGCENCVEQYEEACVSEDGNCMCDICEALRPGHSLTNIEAKAATCTKTGLLASKYCAKCDKYYDAEGAVLSTNVTNALGHQWEAEWFNDAREHGHSKYCERRGCNEKLTVEHTLEIEDTLKGNVHQWFCTSCNFIETGIHVNKDGDTLCDECGHNSSTVVTENSLNNNKQNVTVKVEKVEDEKDALSTWFDNFVGKFNSSSSGESNSSSAPSASVGSSVPSSGSGNGSGTSSGSTASGSGNTSSSTGSSAINGLIQWLASLLNALLGA